MENSLIHFKSQDKTIVAKIEHALCLDFLNELKSFPEIKVFYN